MTSIDPNPVPLAPPPPASDGPWGTRVPLVAALAAVVLLVPALLARVLSPAVVDEELSRLPLLYLALAVATIAAPPARGFGRSTAILVALALATGLSFAFHADRLAYSVGPPGLFVALAGAVVVGAWSGGDASATRRLFAALALCGAAASLWVVLDRVVGRPPVGPFGRAGVTGPALAAMLPLVLVFPRRRLAWVLGAVLALAIGFTGSRTAGAAAVLGFLAALAAARRGAPARKAWLAVSLLALLGFVVVLVSLPGVRFFGSSLVGRIDTVSIREDLATSSARLISERPFTGHGPGSFASEILRVREPREALASVGRRPFAAHDDYLHVAVEGGGIPALALLALVIGSVFVSSTRARRASVGDTVPFASAAGSCLAIGVSALGEDPFLAAPTVLIFGLVAGAASGGGALATRVAPRVVPRLLRFAAFAVFVAAAWFHGRAYVAEAYVAGYVEYVSRPHEDSKAVERASSFLSDGALAADPRCRDALYRLGAHLARFGRYEEARAAYRRLWEIDPGATEARLDVAETYRLEGRFDDARTVLDEAGRRDPTRFDVPLRLGHLLLGPEMPPSLRARPEDPIKVLERYDEAALLGPYRFEWRVAHARLYRRLGNLAQAGASLREADAVDPKRAEILVESFREEEAQGAAPLASAGILALALAKDPAKAGEIRAEALRCLDAGEEEEKAAKERSKQSRTVDFAAADADFEAAALRFAGLVTAGAEDPRALRAAARVEAPEDRHRRALARYRALLADPFATPDADLAFEAASSASRVNGDLALQLKARGRVLIGFEALAKGDIEAALKDFRTAREKDPRSVAAHWGLARALARAGKVDDAAAALRQAIDLDPSAAEHAAQEPDLSTVWPLVRPP